MRAFFSSFAALVTDLCLSLAAPAAHAQATADCPYVFLCVGGPPNQVHVTDSSSAVAFGDGAVAWNDGWAFGNAAQATGQFSLAWGQLAIYEAMVFAGAEVTGPPHYLSPACVEARDRGFARRQSELRTQRAGSLDSFYAALDAPAEPVAPRPPRVRQRC